MINCSSVLFLYVKTRSVLMYTAISRLIPQVKENVHTEIKEEVTWLSQVDPGGLWDLFSHLCSGAMIEVRIIG